MLAAASQRTNAFIYLRNQPPQGLCGYIIKIFMQNFNCEGLRSPVLGDIRPA